MNRKSFFKSLLGISGIGAIFGISNLTKHESNISDRAHIIAYDKEGKEISRVSIIKYEGKYLRVPYLNLAIKRLSQELEINGKTKDFARMIVEC